MNVSFNIFVKYAFRNASFTKKLPTFMQRLLIMIRIVSLYLDYAELQAQRHIPMSMEDWSKRLDTFLEFNGNELLIGAGKISAEQAKLHAETEYEKYRIVQDRLYESDFDKFLLQSNTEN